MKEPSLAEDIIMLLIELTAVMLLTVFLSGMLVSTAVMISILLA